VRSFLRPFRLLLGEEIIVEMISEHRILYTSDPNSQRVPAPQLLMAESRYLLQGEAEEVINNLASIYVWLRYSSARKLTWQRNYNTQPRILGDAQKRLTNSIAQVLDTIVITLLLYFDPSRPCMRSNCERWSWEVDALLLHPLIMQSHSFTVHADKRQKNKRRGDHCSDYC
jgi:hypothetical protein